MYFCLGTLRLSCNDYICLFFIYFLSNVKANDSGNATTTSAAINCKELISENSDILEKHLPAKEHPSVQEMVADIENSKSLIPKKVMTKQPNQEKSNMGDANLLKTSKTDPRDLNVPKTSNEQEAYGIT